MITDVSVHAPVRGCVRACVCVCVCVKERGRRGGREKRARKQGRRIEGQKGERDAGQRHTPIFSPRGCSQVPHNASPGASQRLTRRVPVRVPVDSRSICIASGVVSLSHHQVLRYVRHGAAKHLTDAVAATDACEPKVVDVVVVDRHANGPTVHHDRLIDTWKGREFG